MDTNLLNKKKVSRVLSNSKALFEAHFMKKLSNTETTEAVAQTCSVKKVFLEIYENAQENTCARASFLIKLQA